MCVLVEVPHGEHNVLLQNGDCLSWLRDKSDLSSSKEQSPLALSQIHVISPLHLNRFGS